jgi:PAS domain S-box-containing protein
MLLHSEKSVGGRLLSPSKSIDELASEVAQLQAEQARTQQELADFQTRRRLISQAINSVIIDWNLVTNKYERVTSLEQVMGYRVDEIELNPSWSRSTVHPDDLARFDKVFQDCLQSEATELHLDVRCRHKDGRYRHLRGHAAVDRDPETKKARRIIVCYSDITPEVEAQQALSENEERYRLATDAMQGIIFDNTIDTGQMYWSSGVQRYLGYPSEAVLPHVDWWIAMIHPDDKDAIVDHFTRFIAGKETHGNVSYRVRHYNGRYIKVNASYLAFRDETGKANRLLGCIVDLSPSVDAERAQQVAERNFHQLFQAIPLGLIVISPSLQIIECNAALATMLDYTPKELVGMHIGQLSVAEEWKDPPVPLESDSANGFDYSWERNMVRKDGTRIPVHVRGKLVPYPHFDEPCRFGIIEDLTERRAVEKEKDNLERHLQETQKLESLGVLAGGIAHDFNNLLTVILGNLSFLKQEPLHKNVRTDALVHAEQASLQAAELCRQMLAYAGRGKLENKPFDLSELVESSQALLSSAASRHHHMHFHLSKGLPSVVGDPSQVRQVLLNLVHNAAEAFTTAGGTIDVMTGVEQLNESTVHQCLFRQQQPPGSYVWLEVRDNGPGMDVDVSKRIFEPFFTTKFTGRGLGLAAVAGIVRNHHGLLAYQSKPQAGTTFRIYFPAHGALAQTLDATKPHDASTIEHQGTILVVDDEPTIRIVLAKLLTKRGFAVIEAENGNEALEMVERYASSLRMILLDLTMPQRDGLSTLQELRRQNNTTPVLIISGYYSLELIPQLDSLKAQFLSKPFNAQSLMSKVEQGIIS